MEPSWVHNDPVKIIGSFQVFLCYGLGLGAPDPQLPLIFKSWFSSVTMHFQTLQIISSQLHSHSQRRFAVSGSPQPLQRCTKPDKPPLRPHPADISQKLRADKDDRLCIPSSATGTLFDLKSHFRVLLK